jgi:DNA-binding GntR family transcriptional regulator
MADESGEFAPPKYAQIVQVLRRRIADGTYPPGSLLPSESALVREFGVSRPTVVRALQTMELRGEIDREHGRGSFVKAAPSGPAAGEAARPVRSALSSAEADDGGELVAVGEHPAPAGVARLLGVAEDAPVWLRQRLTQNGGGPGGLVSLWLSVDVARAAGLDQPAPLTTNVRQLLQAGTGSRLGHVAERLTARRPTAAEARLLDVARNACVLGVLASVFDTSGRPLVVAELVLPGERFELEDTYTL